MKSQAQTLMLIAVFVVLIGGITFVRIWVSTKSKETDGSVTADGKETVRLDFPVTVALSRPEYEVYSSGHHDFWFQNPSAQAVEIGLDEKGCTCSEVQVRVLTPDEANMIREKYLQGVSPVLDASAGLLPTLGPLAAWFHERPKVPDQTNPWQPLLKKDDASVVSIPAHASGLVRLSWQGRTMGPQRLTATVWAQVAGDSHTRGGYTPLEVPVVFVAPLIVQPETVSSLLLGPNEHRDVECYVWSVTRADFKVTSAQEEFNNPCFVCSFRRMTGADLEKVTAGPKPLLSPHVLNAYRILVTVYERQPDKGQQKGRQLDLGPFQHKLVMKTDQADCDTVTVMFSGTVRGDISVGTGDSRDKINLHHFPAAKGTTATIPLQANQPGLELALDSKSPDYLVVELTKHPGEEGKRWDLKVKVPRGQSPGTMPPESAVILKVQTQPPRLIRIPVVGMATQ